MPSFKQNHLGFNRPPPRGLLGSTGVDAARVGSGIYQIWTRRKKPAEAVFSAAQKLPAAMARHDIGADHIIQYRPVSNRSAINVEDKNKENTMYKKLITVAFASLLFAGCAAVPMEDIDKSTAAKQFNPPSEGKAGLYIYRKGTFGGALKKNIWVDDKCIGETAPNTFFYEEVEGDKEHKISTESEFSPNDMLINTRSGENYFIQQYIKMGLFVGGANLKQVNEEEGKTAVETLGLAEKGYCASGRQSELPIE